MHTSDCGPMAPSWAEQVGALVSRLAHDLRQPLTTIETAAYCLGLILPPGDSRCRAPLEILFQQVDVANRMLGDALEQLRSIEGQASTPAAAAESRCRTNAAMSAGTY